VIAYGGVTATGSAALGGSVYDDGNNLWTKMNQMNGPQARLGASIGWSGAQLYAICGRSPSGHGGNTGYAYTPGTDMWRPLATANGPTPRADAFSQMTANGFLVAGGIDDNDNPLRDAYLFDGMNWTQVASMPTGTARTAPFGRIGWT